MKNFNFGGFLLKHRWQCWAVGLFFVLLSFCGMGNFYFNPLVDSNFNTQSEMWKNHKSLNDVFLSGDGIVAVLNFNESIFSVENFGIIRDVTSALNSLPRVSSVSSITNAALPTTSPDGNLAVGFLDQINDISTAAGSDAARVMAQRKTLRNIYFSSDERSAVIYASINYSSAENTIAEKRAIYNRILELGDVMSGACGNKCDVFLNGMPVTEFELLKIAEKEQKIAILSQNIALLVVMAILTASIRAAGFVCIIAFISSVGALGIPSLLGFEFNTMSIAGITIVSAILFAQAIHLVWQYMRHLALGIKAAEAIEMSINEISKPALITFSATTVAYISIALNDSPALFVLGFSLMTGSFVGLLLTFLILPHMLVLIKRKPKYIFSDVIKIDGLGRFITSHYLVLFFLVMPIIAAFSVFSLQASVSESTSSMLGENNPYRLRVEKADAEVGVSSGLSMIVSPIGGSSVESAGFMLGAIDYSDWARRHPGVSSVSSIADAIPEIVSIINPDKKNPLADSDVEDAFFLYKLALPYGSDIGQFVSADKSRIKININFWKPDTGGVVDFTKDSIAYLAERGISGEPAGLHYIFCLLIDNYASNEIYSYMAITICCFLIMLFLFRKTSVALAIAITTSTPVLCALSFVYLSGGHINMAVCVAIAMAAGLTVDETMHIMNSFFKKLKENINPIAAAKHSILSSGSGSIIAGLVLIIGFYAAAIPVEWVAFTVTANFIAVAIASSLIIQFFCLIPYLILSNTAKFKAAA